MVRGLSRLGSRLRLSEGFVGLLTALGADAPELSSAVIAVIAGSRAVGVGVVLGSNLFNLAALLGLAALLSGHLALHRSALLLDGGVGVIALLLAGVLIAGWLPGAAVAALLVMVFAAYAAALALKPATLERLAVPRALRAAVVQSSGHLPSASDLPQPKRASYVVPLLPVWIAAVVLGSLGLVHSALDFAALWHVPQAITGGLVLAVLTSLPNAYAAVHLGRRGRGTAVMSEAMNSNTLNLLGGLVLPAAILGGAGIGGGVGPTYLWLAGLTVLVLALCARKQMLRRVEAFVVIAVYLGFVVFLLRSA